VETAAGRDIVGAVKIGPPTNPFHIARAYGVSAPQSVRPQAPVEPVAPVSRNDASGASVRKRPSNIDRLVGAVVPGRIDFTDEGPRHESRSEAIPLYRHPADLNAAATNIYAGRSLDVSG
jgi:hypothetical protein